ncbi:MAG TPA: ABC transporter ATP-binding protein [Spirochaetota bacterium]|nr:ABC transporter ATP-binding protein [Spirochaetota bacterium]
MEISVEVKNLTKRFDKFTAVDGINFSVRKGEIFGFLGPNGAGKSTTIKMLCGILSPTDGTGTVSGYDIVNEQDKIKNTIGYMSQKFSLYHDLTVRENLEFFGSIYGLAGRILKERIDYVREMAGIGDRMDSKVDILPGGIKQRLALGGAILHDPPVLFLDEPTSGVDPLMRRNFWDLIYNFSREGKTIFVTTHYMDEAEHCNRMALVIAGKIIALDTPDNLKQNLPYSVYALQVDDFIKVFEKISKLEFIEEAAIFGSDIHILCDRKYKLKSELGKVLNNIGVTDYRIDQIPASLEDVFVTHARRLGV